MDAERYERLQALFESSRELPARERDAFVAESTADDPELRAMLEGLLAHHERPLGFFSDTSSAPGASLLAREIAQEDASGASDELPDRIGHYRIVGVIGRGGMGVVYEAEQEEPKRHVALKVIHSGIHSDHLLRRFRLEAHVLGQLEHPGVARIYEAGTFERDGATLPYFAMERIVGRSLSEFVGESRLAPNEILELVAKICDAIEHAHRKGVIHRDLKPGNVLVDETARPAQPKVVDFGIARATDADIQTVTIQTSVGQLVGTVPYMSPEQASGDPARLDARSDVYSLGVILYELLAGRLPYEVRDKPLHEAVLSIQNDEPTRLTTIDTRFRGDVDTIVSKALEKDANRRYASAGAMADDIRRYLADEPIVARPASTFYQLRKFARRNRALVTGVSIAFVALLAGALIAIWQALVAIEYGRDAEQKAEIAISEAIRAGLSAASAAVDARDPFTHAHEIEHVPPERRGWEWHHIANQIDRSICAYDAKSPIVAAGFGDEGTRVLAVTSDGHLAAFETYAGDPIATRDLGTSPIRAAAFSRDGRRVSLIFGARAASLRIVETGDGDAIVRVDLPEPCMSVAFSDDGRNVVGGGKSGAWVWNESSGGPRELDGVPAARVPRGFAFFADAPDLVAITALRAFVGIYSLSDAKAAWSVSVDANRFRSLAASPSDPLAAIGEEGNKVYLARIRSSAAEQVLRGHSGPVLDVEFSRDGSKLASGGDRTVRVWNPRDGSALAVFTGHESQVRAVRFHPDGTKLLSIARSGPARLFSLRGSGDVAEFFIEDSHARGLALSTDGELLYSATIHRRVDVWSAATLEHLGSFPSSPPKRGSNGAESIAMSPDGRTVAVGHFGGLVQLIDSLTGRAISSVRTNLGIIRALGFSRDGETLFVRAKGALEARSVPGLEQVAMRRLRRVDHRGGLAILPDGSVLVVDGETLISVRGEAVEDDRVVLTLESPLRDVVTSADGAIVAVADDTGAMTLVERENGAKVTRVDGGEEVSALALSADGSRLASGHPQGSIVIRDSRTGHELARLHGHTSTVLDLEFSRDSTRLFSIDIAGSVRIWDVEPNHVRWQTRNRRRKLRGALRERLIGILDRESDPRRALDSFSGDESADAREIWIAAREALIGIASEKLRPELVNVALGRPARQSSTVPGYSAQVATDGVFRNWTSSAADDTDAWLEIDLGETRAIARVVVHNRGDGRQQERLRDIVVSISSDSIDSTKEGDAGVWRSEVLNPDNELDGPAALEVSPSPPIAGRWVRVQSKSGVLAVAEVEVLVARP